MKAGDTIHTPRFLTVTINEVLTPDDAQEKGYKEPTHYERAGYDILGKSIGLNRMVFAAIRKEQ